MPRKPKLAMSDGIRTRVLKNGTRRYDAVAYVGRRQQKRSFKTHDDAEKWRNRTKVHLADGTYQALKPIRFEAYLAEWKETYLILAKLKASTIRGYRTILDSYIEPQFTGYWLAAIDAYEVQKFEAKLLGQVSNKTTHNAMTLLGRMFKNARKDGFLKVSPMADYEKTAYDCEPGRALTPAEVDKLFAKCDEHLRLIVMLGVKAGLRRAEILSLHWTEDRNQPRSWVDFEANKIRIRKNIEWLSRKHGQVEDGKDAWRLVKPKSVAGIRDVPMSPELKFELQQFSFKEGDGLIFHTASGNPLNPSNVANRWFKPAVKRAKIGDVSLHDLRHTCGSVWLDRGAGLYDVMRWMGHADIDTTIRVYGHPVTDRGAEVTKAADEYFNAI